MPQFAIHCPVSAFEMRKRLLPQYFNNHNPIGVISKNGEFEYGYDGDKYYVTESVFKFFVTKIHLSFDEAKQLCNALSFIEALAPCTKKVALSIKNARKQKLSGDTLFWHFTETVQ